MIFIFLLLVEIVFFFFLSQALTRLLSKFLSIQTLSLLFLPGIIIHELSHFFMATILFVSVSDIEFLPKIINDRVKLGSISIAKTDPIRRLAIGLAPIISGLSIFFFLGDYLAGSNFLIKINILIIVSILYLLFAIANTMFSSKKDLEGALALFILTALLFITFYILGFSPQASVFELLPLVKIIAVVKTIELSLLIPLTIDLSIVGLFKLLKK